MTVVHALLLALASVALLAVALRIVSRIVPHGLERALAAAVVAVAAAGGEALVLGWVGLGMDSFVLTGATVLTWFVAARMLPAPELSAGGELADWWGRLGTRERAMAGGIAGVSLATLAWWVLRPKLGYDTLLYHLPLAVTWVQDGDPGAVNDILPRGGVGAYAALDELMLAWSAGIARSFVPFSVWPVLLLVITVAAGWLGLRSLAVPRAAAALGLAAVVVSQQVAGWQDTGASTDPSALAWLVVTAGLCAASSARGERAARPALLAPALLAAALAVGTKPTVAPLALFVLIATGAAHRSQLRAIARPLALAVAAGCLVGGWWYIRNTALYGSPLWPFYEGPWGTALPEGARAGSTFLGNVEQTVDSLGGDYLEVFGGSLLLIVAALLVPLLDRSRLVVCASAATGLAVLAWTLTPNTGLSDSNPLIIAAAGTVSTVRYLVGGVAAAALAVALVTRRPGAVRWIAYTVLAVAALVNVVQTLDLGRPAVPSVLLLLAGAAAGALAAAGTRSMPRVWPAPAVAVAVAVLALAIATPGYLDRLAAHGLSGQPDGELMSWFLDQPSFEDGERPLTTLPKRESVFAGPRLGHPVELDDGRSCAELHRRARDGWVVVWGARAVPTRGLLRPNPLRCFAGTSPAHRNGAYDVFTERR